jgi:uncharacterized protein (DUF1697 family)
MKFVSLLRGINVSGQKSIKMADLKALYDSLGFQNVLTYIQSGNVIFDSAIQHKDELKTMIEAAIQEAYGFQVPVQIRTRQEIGEVIDNCPFGEIDLEKDGRRVLVTFLASKPANKRVAEIQEIVEAPDQFVWDKNQIYLYVPGGYGRSKLSNNFIEGKLKVEATTRNWKTIFKLYELSVD